MRRAGLPEEVAATIAFLASAVAAYITGSTVIVDGGADAWGQGTAPAGDRTSRRPGRVALRGDFRRSRPLVVGLPAQPGGPSRPRSLGGVPHGRRSAELHRRQVGRRDRRRAVRRVRPGRPARSSRPRRTRQPADVERAVDAARRTFDDGTWWPGTSERERGRILLRAADIVRRELDRLAELESLDCGKPIGEAREDIDEVAFMFEYYGGWATKIYGDIPPVGPDAMSLVIKEPMGVAAAHHAVELPDADGGAEGGAGDRRRLHHGAQARRADAADGAARCRRSWRRPGFPAGVLNVVTGLRRDRRRAAGHAARTWTRSASPARRTSARSSCGRAPTR